jgi:hypothetical protein
MSVREPKPDMVPTEFGWALSSETMPPRGMTNIWKKMPEGHVYLWDGDGWARVSPPEKMFIAANHG